MLVSHGHKLVFVHIQKTGGDTVSRLMRESIPDIFGFKAKHEFAVKAAADLECWNEYFKFAFVRNPWDRLVSWYSMISVSDADAAEAHLIPVGQTEKRRLRRARRMKQRGDRLLLWRYVVDNSSTFEEFIKNCTGEIEVKPRVFYSFAYNQLEYISDTNDNLLVDYVGRF